ncbi:MAG: hypothetical protein ACREYA_17380 [Cupriavidus necator]
MATNDFLVFGGGAGANVITQVTYSGLAARTAGFSAGVAQSAQLNKVWRQSSIMSAVLAQFVSDLTGQDVLDDGTTTTILANLKAAVSAQSIGVVGAVRNAKMSVTAASASATFTADEVVVESALGGKAYRLPSVNKAINLATTGAGGMDAGTAPNSGYVALYAIYNPATGASALLARNATSAVQPEVYGGVNMPVGYTASALVSVWPTNASGQFKIGYQRGRSVNFPLATLLSTSTTTGTNTALSVAGAIPPNAVSMGGEMSVQNGSVVTTAIAVSADANPVGQNAISSSAAALMLANYQVPIITPQTVYYTATAASGTPVFTLYTSWYSF